MSRSLYTLKWHFRRPVQRWLRQLKEASIRFTVTSTRRSFAEQNALYQRFLRGESKFPALPPGRSRHQLGTAIDIVFHPDPGGEVSFQEIAALAAAHGIRWAGPGDAVHWDNRPV